jgi:hypothetical protein
MGVWANGARRSIVLLLVVVLVLERVVGLAVSPFRHLLFPAASQLRKKVIASVPL